MKVVIIEDETASADYLGDILKQHFAALHIAAICENVPDAVQAIVLQKPDIVFLDVEIKMGSGFDVLEQAGQIPAAVVFTTAFNNYAVDAFRHHAVDYLLKPLVEAQVMEATQRCIAQIHQPPSLYREHMQQLLEKMNNPVSQDVMLSVPTIDGIEFIEIKDVVCCEAKGNYTELRMKNGTRVLASRKLKEIEESLPHRLFFRIHNSYMVNLRYVKKYHKGRGGYLVLIDGTSIPVASGRKDEFLAWLG